MKRGLSICSRLDEAYYEITKRVFEGDLFESAVLDVYADLKNESEYSIFGKDEIPDIDEIVPIVNEEILYLIEQFCTMSGVDEGDIPVAIERWQEDLFPLLPRMIEGILLKYGRCFDSCKVLSLSSVSENILPCQNTLFPQFKERSCVNGF